MPTMPKKPDLKPSPEFKDNAIKRVRATARLTAVEETPAEDAHDKDKDQPLTQRGRKPTVSSNESTAPPSQDLYHSASLHFPSIFSNDFGPAALLYPTPTLTTPMTYGEGVGQNIHSTEGFSIVRPTIELPLDEILNADSPSGWSSGGFSGTTDVHMADTQDDVDIKPANGELMYPQSTRASSEEDDALLTSTAALRNVPPFNNIEDVLPRTITPSRIGPNCGAGPMPTQSTGKRRPSLSVRTQTATARAAGPGATPVNGPPPPHHQNSAPGGVKAECSNCGATHTPLWRRGLNDELNCNACGLYCKLHKRPRPKSMRNHNGEGRTQSAPRQESQEVIAQCYNCHTTATPLWRKDDEGKTVCNACGLYYKLHGAARPISMKSDVIRKRARHDARRVGPGVSETPSASPGASRRASPSADPTPTLAPDSTTQMPYGVGTGSPDEVEYHHSMQSELMGALGNQNGSYATQNFSFTYPPAFPGPYHPDYMNQVFNPPTDPLPFAPNDGSDVDNSCSDARIHKRRRMSNDSTSEPPSSAVSFSSYADSYTSASSSASHSQRSSVEFPYNSYSPFGIMRGGGSALWHPPMLPPEGTTNSPQFIHPPMLPPDESPQLYQAVLQHDDADALFATYLHPPMIRTEDSPPMSSLQLHPPMLPNEWKPPGGHVDYYDTPMVTF
ncbi:hypothetical protein OBBRIDRAFT_136546 [Obba rivulosa]|uniref:GATA-type domain-containing protein n=1 Tax=Obba rivulosa TaxID=1052685 RepID=A0A8E2DI11_9APHY|nr:hypothetical protein OBBRIDRAFT_136546 [Obba rivulosa]